MRRSLLEISFASISKAEFGAAKKVHPDSKSLLGLEYRENVVLVPFIAIVEKGPDALHTAIDGRGI